MLTFQCAILVFVHNHINVTIPFKYYLKYFLCYYIVFQITILIAKYVIELRCPNFLNHSLIVRYLVCFHYFTVTDNPAINTFMDLTFSPFYYFLRINF